MKKIWDVDHFAETNAIQILRGFAILFVVTHHTLTNLPRVPVSEELLLIVNTDVTIFFIISGFLFEKNYDRYTKEKGTFLFRKAKQLLVPYLFWSLLLYLGGKIVHDLIGGKLSNILTDLGFYPLGWKKIIWNILTFQDYYTEHLWFVYILFFFFLVNILTGQVFRYWWVALIVLLAAPVCNLYMPLPYLAWKFLKHFSDFLVGRLIFQNYVRMQNRRTILAAGFVFISCVLLCNIPVIRMEETLPAVLTNTVAKHLMGWAFCILGFAAGCFLCIRNAGRFIRVIGDYSYDIYLMHIPYVVPVAARVLYAVSEIWTLSFGLTIAAGIGIPMFVSRYILRKLPVIRKIALGEANGPSAR